MRLAQVFRTEARFPHSAIGVLMVSDRSMMGREHFQHLAGQVADALQKQRFEFLEGAVPFAQKWDTSNMAQAKRIRV